MTPSFRWSVLVVLVFAFAARCSLTAGEQDFHSNSTQTLARRKRTLIFHPISRGFFRVNIKDAIADNSTIWAHAVGFRMNIEFYNPPGLKITRRDVHESLESMIMAHGFDGRACLLRTFCEASKVMTPKSGILFKLFRLIFRSDSAGSDDSSIGSSNSLPDGDDKYFPYLTANDCEELDRHCPISQLDMEGMTGAQPEKDADANRSQFGIFQSFLSGS